MKLLTNPDTRNWIIIKLNHSFISSHSNGGVDAFIAIFSSDGNSLLFSSYYGGSGHDWGWGLVFDNNNNLIISGGTGSTELTFSDNKIQKFVAGYHDVLVLKINSDYSLNFSLCIGGDGEDWGNGVAVNSLGNIIVVGKTSSVEYPTKQFFQKDNGGDLDGFVTVIDPQGKDVISSSYLGGDSDDIAYEVSLDVSDRIYIVGETASTDFPIQNAYQQTKYNVHDGFLTILNSEGNDICFSSFIGGNRHDLGRSVVVSSTNDVIVLGFTLSSDFPVINPFQSNLKGSYDIFILKMTPYLSHTTFTADVPWLNVESLIFWIICYALITSKKKENYTLIAQIHY